MKVARATKLLCCVWLLLLQSVYAPAIAQPRRITVTTDLGVELVNALNVQISSEFIKDSAADPYLFRTTRLMRISYNHFAPFRNHPAVLRTQWLSDKIGTGIYLLPLFYKGFPIPVRHTPVSTPILEAVHANRDSAVRIVEDYMQLLSRFYNDAGFDGFQKAYKAAYTKAIAEVSKNLPPADFIPTLEAYYGTRKAGYRIIVNPFFKSGWGMAWEVPGKSGAVANQIAAPFGEQRVSKGTVINVGFNNAEAVRNLSVHEFGHTFVNTLTALPAFASGIAAHKELFQPVPGQPQYSDWETLFNEHLVRAGEVRMALKLGLPKMSEKLQKDYAAWMYLPFFEAQLRCYEFNRKHYPDLRSFLPEIIAALDSMTSVCKGRTQIKQPVATKLYYFYGPDSLMGVRDGKGTVIIQPLYNAYAEDITEPITDDIITLYKRNEGDTVLGYEKFVHFFNRKGEFLLHPYWFDNGPDYLEEGLRRFVEGTQMGFADRYGVKKIPAVYGYVSSFNYGVAFVCEGCRFYRDTTADPEHNQRIGPGKWSVINKQGVKLMDLGSAQPDYRSWDSLATTVASFNYTPYEKGILKKVEAIPNVRKYLVQNHIPKPTGVQFQIVEKPSKSFPYYLVKSFAFYNGIVTDLNTEFLVTANGKNIYRWWGHLDAKDPISKWIAESKEREQENAKNK